MKCLWQSKNGKERCHYLKWHDDEHCLFHKPDKSQDEAAVFWGVIHFFHIFSTIHFVHLGKKPILDFMKKKSGNRYIIPMILIQ